MHTYIHTCIHTYLHGYIHTYIHIHIHTYILTAGTSIALEIRAQEAVQTFRETAGPWDVDMAKVEIDVE